MTNHPEKTGEKKQVPPELLAIGSRLREMRREIGISQVDFAVILDVSLRSYVNYEQGKGSLQHATLFAFSCRFGVDLNWLIVGDDAPDDPDLATFSAELDRCRDSKDVSISGLDRRSIVAKWYSGRHRIRPDLRDDPEFWARLASPDPIKALPSSWARPRSE